MSLNWRHSKLGWDVRVPQLECGFMHSLKAFTNTNTHHRPSHSTSLYCFGIMTFLFWMRNATTKLELFNDWKSLQNLCFKPRALLHSRQHWLCGSKVFSHWVIDCIGQSIIPLVIISANKPIKIIGFLLCNSIFSVNCKISRFAE